MIIGYFLGYIELLLVNIESTQKLKISQKINVVAINIIVINS